MYFSKLLNVEVMVDSRIRERESSENLLDPNLGEPISKDEIKETLKKMSNEKVEGLDQILVEVWKRLGEKGLKWLAELFNVILRTAKMLENGSLVQSSHYTRIKGIFKIVIIIRV